MADWSLVLGLFCTCLFIEGCFADGISPDTAISIIYLVPALMGVTVLVGLVASLWVARESVLQSIRGILARIGTRRETSYDRDEDHLIPKEQHSAHAGTNDHRYGATIHHD